MLVAVAVLAMLAFFVLPPFLQMGAGSSSADPIVVSWKGEVFGKTSSNEQWL